MNCFKSKFSAILVFIFLSDLRVPYECKENICASDALFSEFKKAYQSGEER